MLKAGNILQCQIPRDPVSVVHDEPSVSLAGLFVWWRQVGVIRSLHVVSISAVEDQNKRNKGLSMQLLFKKCLCDHQASSLDYGNVRKHTVHTNGNRISFFVTLKPGNKNRRTSCQPLAMDKNGKLSWKNQKIFLTGSLASDGQRARRPV